MLTETITILLVEDNSQEVLLVQEMLREVEAFRFQLIHASTLAEALTRLTPKQLVAQQDESAEQDAIAAAASVSVILLDLSLPDAQGVGAVTQLLLTSPTIPIVAMADLWDEAIALQTLHKGAQDYLVKGQVDGQLLVRSMRYAMARHEALLQTAIYDVAECKATKTQLLRAKETAEEGSQAKSEFLATMSHELRTPLNAVLGLSQLLRQELFDTLNEKQKEYINCIQSSGEHLLALINDILDLSKVEAGKEQLSFVPLDVRDLCEYCLAMVREQAYDRGLKLTLRIEPEVRICIADERRCRQMLLNLLSNAVKFTLTGEISLIVRKLPKEMSFTVLDTGIGIASEKLPLLFQPFRQLDSGLNRQFPGTGLGLALTRSLARLHGGDVTVKSTLGQGSQFTLCLPDCPSEELLLASSSQEVGKMGEQSCRLRSQSRILLVEHDERSAMVLKDYLQVIGHAVEHLTSGKDFLDVVRSFKPNLILMDAQLPDACTGFDLLAALRREPDIKTLKVVLLTTAVAIANGSQCDSMGSRVSATEGYSVQHCLEVGADDYLSKPIGIAQLEAILMRYL